MSDHTSGTLTTDGFALSPIQRRLHGTAGTVGVTIRLDGPLDRDWLARALAAVVERHEILRTRFPTPPGLRLPLQVIDEPAPVVFGDGAGALAVGLERLDDRAHRLRLELSPLAADRASLCALAEELATAYGGQGWDGEPPLQYADIAAWLDDLRTAEETQAARDGWRRHTTHGASAQRLPPDLAPPTLPDGERLVDAGRVEAVAAALGGTVEALLLAVWHLLLQRVSGRPATLVALASDGRADAMLAGALGPLEERLPCRLAIDPAAPLPVAALTAQVAGLREWQSVFDPALLDGGRGEPAEALPHGFVFIDLPAPGAVGGLRLSVEALSLPGAGYDVDLTAVRDGAALRLSGLPERLADVYGALLDDLLARPEAAAGDLDLLGDGARRHLLGAFNATAAAIGPSVVSLFETAADRVPTAPAVVGDGVTLDFATLDRRANRVARRLLALGIGAESRVGLFGPRTPDLVVGLLGILKAGAAFVPLDPVNPADRVAFMAEDAGMRAVVAVSGWEDQAPPVPRLVVDDDEDTRPGVRPAPDTLAYVLYTSGSTGRPKGVMVTHGGLSNYLGWALGAYRMEEGTGVPVHTSISFDLTVTALVAPLLAGVPVVLMAEDPALPRLAAGLAQGPGWSVVKLTPSHLHALAADLPAGTLAQGTRRFVVGGEALFGEALAPWRRHAPAVRVINEYGPTETVVGCCVLDVAAGELADGPVPIGRPIANTSLYVLDGRLNPLPAGVAGELFIGGAGVARGYHGRPDLTAERFVPDPFGDRPGARLYRTGDLVRHRDDGVLEYLGRADSQVKLNGYRIELGEVEAALLRHPAVHHAAVLLLDNALVAFVAPKAGESLDPGALRTAVGVWLPAYMVPGRVVVVEQLPLAASGKIDRKALPALADAAPVRPMVPPRTPTEALLAGLWRDILGHEAGVFDDFIERGGDSIRGLQLVAKAKRAGLLLPADAVFRHRTIAEQAAAATPLGITAEVDTGAEAVADVPLTPIQAAFFAADPVEPQHEVQALLLRPPSPLTAEALSAAMAAVERRHAMLRARFRRGADGVWTQSVAAAGFPAQAVESPAADIRADSAARHAALDLEHGPIWGATLYQRDDGQRDGGQRDGGQRLHLYVHHLAMDGVSWGILLDDLSAALKGEDLSRRPPPVPYARWAAALATAKPDASFWDGVPAAPPRPLPVDDATGSTLEGAAGTVTLTFGEALTAALFGPANRAGRTQPHEVLLTALALAVAETSGGGPVLVDLEHHGRDPAALAAGGGGAEMDLSQTVGWFTALYPVLLPAAGALAVKEALRAVPGNGIPFGLSGRGSGAEILFNHLGRFGDTLSGFAMAAEPLGAMRSPHRHRRHALEIVTTEVAGRLYSQWTHTARLSSGRVEALAAAFRRHAEELARWGADPASARLTPSDAPRVRLDQPGLDALAARFGAGAIADILPATPMQAGMVYHSLRAPRSGVYVEQTACRFAGALPADLFRRGWEWLTERHAALRTLFTRDADGMPVRLILTQAPLDWRGLDWRGRGDHEAALSALLAGDAQAGFDLEAAPAQRFHLVRLGDEEWWFLWTRHHALLDGWSLSPLLAELTQAMRAFAAGAVPDLPPPPSPVAHLEWLAARDAAADAEFWRRHLAEVTGPTPVGGRPAGATPDTSAERLDLTLDAEAGDRLLSAARVAGVTPATLVQGAWALLLARLAGEPAAVIGVTTAGRPPEVEGAERMIGLFINTLPIRVAVDDAAPAAVWLRRVQETVAAARQHEHCALSAIQGWSRVPPGVPLFESIVVYENYPVDPALLAGQDGGLRLVSVDTVERTSFPLALSAGIEGGRVLLSLRYDGGRFTGAEARDRLERLRRLLLALAADPAAPLARFDAMDAAERALVTTGFNATAYPHPRGVTLHGLIAGQAALAGDAVAVVAADGVLTARELDDRATALAHRLVAAGVGRGAVVGVCAERSAALMVALLAVLKAGAAYLPLEPDLPPARLAAMVEDAAAAVVLAGPGVADRLPAGVVVLDPAETGDAVGELPAVGGADLAYVLFTSGSTGRPKGVMISHDGIVNRLSWMQRAYGLTPADRVLQKTPIGFDVSVWELFWPLMTGAALVMAPPGAHKDPAALAGVIAAHRVTVLHFVPSMLRAFLAAPGVETSCGTLRLVVTSGEALTGDLVAAWTARFAARLDNLYGPTEASVDVTAWTCGAAEAAGVVPIGRPIDNVTAYVLDAGMRPVPLGAVGDLWLGGVQVARGYIGRPDLTAEAFRPDPFASDTPAGGAGGRLYRTGDRASWRGDGALLFHGRADAQVKLRGVRIELGEIEAALLGEPGVRGAAARLVGAGDTLRVAAYVVLDDGGLTPEALSGRLARRLPEAMRPAVIVPLAALPLTASGKTDRKALPEPAASAAAPVLPRDPLELRLLALVRQVTGVEGVGIDDDLLALGITSLSAVRLVNRIAGDLGVTLPLNALFDARTVALLAALLRGEEGMAAPSPLVLLRPGVGRPRFCVHPLGGDVACFLRLAGHLGDGRPFYGVQAVGLVGGEPPLDTIDALADRYLAGIRAVQPAGPYSLAGYSLGCAVAFAMARRLRAAGEAVASLVLIDGSALPPPPEDDGGESRDARLDRLLGEAAAAGMLPAGVGRAEAERMLRVVEANGRALAGWHPDPAPVAAVLIRSAETGDSRLGWDRVALGGVSVLDLPGSHRGLVDEPVVGDLAAALERAG